MSEEKNEQIEVNVNDWFAVCDAEENVQVIFPTENFAQWYLDKYGWSRWTLRQISGRKPADNLLFSEEQHRRTEDDQH